MQPTTLWTEVRPPLLSQVRVYFSLLLTVCFLTGCGQSDQPAPPPLPDPAMQPSSQATTPFVDPAEKHLAALPGPTVDPTAPTRRDGQIFFPQTGWVDETEFWTLYEQQPERIPPNIDLHAAHLLKQEMMRETQAASNAIGKL